MTTWTFNPPTVLEGPIGGGSRLWEFFKLDRGVTIVLLPSGNYKKIRYPEDNTLDNYPQVYRGGYNYTVDDATREALINSNIGITTDNFTEQ